MQLASPPDLREEIAADPGVARLGDAEHRRGRERGVDRVPAALERPHAGTRRERMARRHHCLPEYRRTPHLQVLSLIPWRSRPLEFRSPRPITAVMSLLAETERVLVVDDEEAIRMLLARMLGAHGYECATAASAAEGRELLSAQPFALVLSDVNMPGESGLDFAHEVLSTIPIPPSCW